jgi:hypothetical protein
LNAELLIFYVLIVHIISGILSWAVEEDHVWEFSTGYFGSRVCTVKKVSAFPSLAWMSLTKLSLAGTGKSLNFFYSVLIRVLCSMG